MNHEELQSAKADHKDRCKARRRILRDMEKVAPDSHAHSELALRLQTEDRKLNELESRMANSWRGE
ncbi:unnamed protein product [marine sediment metagenome]|uniref:Uncharacterized protein n=1 Tax=marine sediment metagenome TaxID=412755 RepID=X0WYU0_9ZZZZ